MVGLIAALVVSAGTVILTAGGTISLGYGVALAFDLLAAAIFVEVSWRHWPARIFALPAELPALQHGLRRRAITMTTLVGLGYLVALATSLG